MHTRDRGDPPPDVQRGRAPRQRPTPTSTTTSPREGTDHPERKAEHHHGGVPFACPPTLLRAEQSGGEA